MDTTYVRRIDVQACCRDQTRCQRCARSRHGCSAPPDARSFAARNRQRCEAVWRGCRVELRQNQCGFPGCRVAIAPNSAHRELEINVVERIKRRSAGYAPNRSVFRLVNASMRLRARQNLGIPSRFSMAVPMQRVVVDMRGESSRVTDQMDGRMAQSRSFDGRKYVVEMMSRRNIADST